MPAVNVNDPEMELAPADRTATQEEEVLPTSGPVYDTPFAPPPAEMTGVTEGEASAPSPISPYIDPSADSSVAADFHVSPPSSQPPMSSPMEHPDQRFLGLNQSTTTPVLVSHSQSPTGTEILSGPMTRSRTRSHSPHPTALTTRSQTTSGKPKSKGKSQRK